MAVLTKAQLKTESNTTFLDNTDGEITASNHRAFNTDLIDSMVTQDQITGSAIGLAAANSATSSIVSSGGDQNSSASAARADHSHNFNAQTVLTAGNDIIIEGNRISVNPQTQPATAPEVRNTTNVGGVTQGVQGTSTYVCRSDHNHAINFDNSTSMRAIGTTGYIGSSTYPAHADHSHGLTLKTIGGVSLFGSGNIVVTPDIGVIIDWNDIQLTNNNSTYISGLQVINLGNKVAMFNGVSTNTYSSSAGTNVLYVNNWGMGTTNTARIGIGTIRFSTTRYYVSSTAAIIECPCFYELYSTSLSSTGYQVKITWSYSSTIPSRYISLTGFIPCVN